MPWSFTAVPGPPMLLSFAGVLLLNSPLEQFSAHSAYEVGLWSKHKSVPFRIPKAVLEGGSHSLNYSLLTPFLKVDAGTHSTKFVAIKKASVVAFHPYPISPATINELRMANLSKNIAGKWSYRRSCNDTSADRCRFFIPCHAALFAFFCSS